MELPVDFLSLGRGSVTRVIQVIKWTLKVRISYPRGLEVLSLKFDHPDYKGSSLFR